MNYSQIVSRSCNAQAVSRCISPRSQGFAPGFVRKDFVVDKVTLVKVFLRALRLSSVSVIPPWPSILIYHLGMSNSSVGDRSSETISLRRHEQQQKHGLNISMLICSFLAIQFRICSAYSAILIVLIIRHAWAAKVKQSRYMPCRRLGGGEEIERLPTHSRPRY
jgi:hypothetical protein